ncbi:hypothetical protein [Dolichospermum circinale]|uniref:hypothetical protein n=1 Tax=Dolichospermum circinale TaxID=109265 RepID=UPI0012DF8655|nr:hypothetical protein [Dolichospermum circinale]MDB9474855.1 hypothetical protein [Dolichospermum circinale CS-537/11]MDB9478593.1 hypothetical protein [Dolichospermum circinale CS-537/03]MDB9484204.1 hypothetical protein [Dolichospermum circinale CS-537/05]
MLNQSVASDLVVDLSVEEQQLLSGGHGYHGYHGGHRDYGCHRSHGDRYWW